MLEAVLAAIVVHAYTSRSFSSLIFDGDTRPGVFAKYEIDNSKAFSDAQFAKC